MSRESEFLTRHKDDLKRGAELCRLLQGNMVEARPREKHYLELRLICKRLEGTSRQMAHERGDDFTWLQLGHHYVDVGKKIQALRRAQKWAMFGKMAEVFDAGLARIDRLATAATGLTSLNSSSLLILPKFLRSTPANDASKIILP
jgi:hypothetical protein